MGGTIVVPFSLLPLLLYLLILLPQPPVVRALTSAQLPVAERTHTFDSYLQDPVFTPLVPVFVATALRLRGVYCQDDVKSLNGGVGLSLRPETRKSLGRSLYRIVDVYQSPRGDNRYQSIGTGSPDPFFAFKQEGGKVRLMVNMRALSEYYLPLAGSNLIKGKGTKPSARGHRPRKTKHDFGYFYDPSGLDGVSPYFPGLTPADIRKLQRREQKQTEWDQRQYRKVKRELMRYAEWVVKQVGASLEGPIPNITNADLDKFYANVNGTMNKRLKLAYMDGSGQYVSISQRPRAVRGGRSLSAADTGQAQALGIGDDGQVEAENYSATSHIYTYAIIFSGPDGALQRLDLTIVPKVFRRSTTHSGFLCKPDGSEDPIKLSPYLRDYIPRTDSCAAYTSRAAPYALSSPDYATLHPEEAAWLASRLDKTAPLVQSFVSSKLPGKPPLTNTQARLRIGISNMGGGKRALFYSLGVTEALHKLGIFDQASWASGLSGSAWYITAHYAAMLDKTETVSPRAVFEDIKSRANNTIWDDVFEGNEALTDVGPLWGAPFHPSRLGDKNRTAEVFCEGELRLQWPNMSARGAASTLEYYSRAVSTQTFPSNWADVEGLGVTFSSFASSRLLSTHSAPLPLYQTQENLGDGMDYFYNYRLWEISPFDMATNDGSLHVSFPTALLGSRGQSTDTCTVGLDNVGYVQGISSYAFWEGDQTKRTCASSSGQTAICRPTEVRNPFEGFAAISSSDLYSKPNLLLTDGGWNNGHPMWMYLSPSRQADVVFVVDSGGGSKPEDGPVLSTDTVPNPRTCPADASRIQSRGCVPWPGTACCWECLPALAGCFSTNNVTKSYLFMTLEAYKTKMRDNTVPPYPRMDGSNFNASDPKSQFGQRVLFFGCDNVSNKTPLVVIPNRIVISGQSGHGTEKGAINVKIPFIPAPEYKLNDVDIIFDNSEAGLPSLPGLPDFATCVACLYYAKALGQDSFMRTDPDCQPCYDSYCWVPTS